MWYENWALEIDGILIWLRYPDRQSWQRGQLMKYDRVQGFSHGVDYQPPFHTNLQDVRLLHT